MEQLIPKVYRKLIISIHVPHVAKNSNTQRIEKPMKASFTTKNRYFESAVKYRRLCQTTPYLRSIFQIFIKQPGRFTESTVQELLKILQQLGHTGETCMKITKYLAKSVNEIGTGLKIGGDSTAELHFLHLRVSVRVLMRREYFEIPSLKLHMKKHIEWTYGIAQKMRVNLRYLVLEKIQYVKYVTRTF